MCIRGTVEITQHWFDSCIVFRRHQKPAVRPPPTDWRTAFWELTHTSCKDSDCNWTKAKPKCSQTVFRPLTHTHTHTDRTDETSVSEILSISFSRKCQWKRQNEEQRSVRPVTGAAAGNASHWSSHSNSKVYELWQSLHIRCQQTNTRVFVFEPCKFGEHILTYKRKYNLITS